MATGKQQKRFGAAKSSRLTTECKQCDVYPLCYGGCPKHRLLSVEGEKYRQNFLCTSYRQIFHHTAPIMQMMVDEIRRGGIAANIMTRL